VSCDEVVAQALSNLRAAIQESGADIQRIPLPAVMGTRTQVLQLFQNLISNAIKFRRRDVPLKITLEGEKQGESQCLFRVRDNGIGFPQESAARIFEIYQRLHSRKEYPGSGLGLSVCKKIIERHGGRIWAEAKEGGGATFYFTLPSA
jgi:light-regulated signal transduction histidine kinase (bacteriophytochrome)